MGSFGYCPMVAEQSNDGEYEEVRFAGWLGLLGALYNVTGGAAGPPLGDPGEPVPLPDRPA